MCHRDYVQTFLNHGYEQWQNISRQVILATTLDRFCQSKNLAGIIDCSDVFIETPKNLELQSATWSEYKHHNTIKFLVCVAPNSSIIYISEFYTGCISNKALTKESGFLDELPSYSSIRADNRFNIFDECTARNIDFTPRKTRCFTDDPFRYKQKKCNS